MSCKCLLEMAMAMAMANSETLPLFTAWQGVADPFLTIMIF
ncbi:hypothetical protein [Vibrio harveyi]